MTPDEMRVVAEFAALAPSVHNTQPWRFVARPFSLDVHLDQDRALTYLDPGGRQLHLSCGLVTEFARLAIRSMGSACTVRLMPTFGDDTLVATLTVGAQEPPTPWEQRMVAAAPRRYTDRGPYSDEPISRLALAHMREAVSERGCWLRVLDREDDRMNAIRLLSRAEDAESQDDAYHSELAQWRRTGRARDGLPVGAFSVWDNDARVTDVPLRDFTGANSHPEPGDGEPPVVERDTVVVLGTDRDEPVSWLRAGRAVADLLLVLTDADLVCQPLGPVLDVAATRDALRHELGFIGHPQLMLRIGHGTQRPTTGRRGVDELLTTVSGP